MNELDLERSHNMNVYYSLETRLNPPSFFLVVVVEDNFAVPTRVGNCPRVPGVGTAAKP